MTLQLFSGGALINRIPESGFGNKLSKKMDWTGGVLAKDDGIDTDVSFRAFITPVVSHCRSGLGLMSDFHAPQGCIRQVIAEYVKTFLHKDLVFSPEFSREDQAMICKEATMQGLVVSHHNSGNPGKQYIVLSQCRTIPELVEYIRANGGETPQHVLLEPASGLYLTVNMKIKLIQSAIVVFYGRILSILLLLEIQEWQSFARMCCNAYIPAV